MSISDVAECPAAPEEAARRVGRVCVLVDNLTLGGAQKQAVLLALGLRARGVDVTVLTLLSGGPREAALRAAGIPVIGLGFRRRPAAPGNVRAFWRLVSTLRRIRPDLLHAFIIRSYLAGAPAARLAGVPVMVAGRRGPGYFKEGHRLALLVERLATRATDLIIANADSVAEYTRTREGVAAEKITVIRNAIPDSALEVAKPALVRTDLPVVTCVANLWPHKGHRYLIDAAGILAGQGMPCTLVLAGYGPQRDELERQAAELGVDARFLGSCPDLRPVLARADVVVLPSLSEGMSNGVMEAMAAGRPVVATSVGASPELLGEGRGTLVPPKDPAALAAALAALLADPVAAARRGAAAREWIRVNCTIDALADRHLQVYSALLSAR